MRKNVCPRYLGDIPDKRNAFVALVACLIFFMIGMTAGKRMPLFRPCCENEVACGSSEWIYAAARAFFSKIR
jgi:hypothetical protein